MDSQPSWWRITLTCPVGHQLAVTREPLRNTDGHYVLPDPGPCHRCEPERPPKGPSERAVRREVRRFRRAMKRPPHHWWGTRS